jgi:hypothetical protein
MDGYADGIRDFPYDVAGMTPRQAKRRAREIIQTATWMWGYEERTPKSDGFVDAALDSVGC